jgi:competence protein ComEC
MPDPQAQLLAGLLLGDNNFTDEWKQNFMRTGTSHVVAASGYNVALVSSLAFAFLIYAGLKRQYAFPFVIAAVAGFVIIAGAEAAVTRAGIMGVIGLSAVQLGRKSSAKIGLLLTVAIMLALEPRLLRDDPGFQLSVLSTMGLMAFAKPISKKIDWIPERFGIRESFACTLAATLATLPISIFSFHRLSLVGPLTNLMILPFLPYAMAAGTFGVIADIFLNRALSVVTLPGWLLLELILGVIQAMSNLPFAVINL